MKDKKAVEGKPWFCVVINSTAHYGKAESVVEELKGVLLSSDSEILVINEPEIVSTGEYFVFISGKQFLKRKDDILKLSSVLRIISVGEKPYCFSDKEVSKFTQSIEKRGHSVTFKKGDIVVIKDGYLKNLFGLVTGLRDNKVRVLLRFYVRDFEILAEPKELKLEKSIFDNIPVNMDKKEWFDKFVK